MTPEGGVERIQVHHLKHTKTHILKIMRWIFYVLFLFLFFFLPPVPHIFIIIFPKFWMVSSTTILPAPHPVRPHQSVKVIQRHRLPLRHIRGQVESCRERHFFVQLPKPPGLHTQSTGAQFPDWLGLVQVFRFVGL